MASAKSEAARGIYAHGERLVRIARAIHADPETAFTEARASAHLVDCLSDIGFEIRSGVGGLASAFVATRGSGDLHVAMCAEYDALGAGIGHGSGRHLVAGAAVAAALGLAPLADGVGMTVSVVGTPGADLLELAQPPDDHLATGKTALLKTGVFGGAHAVLMLIPTPSFTGFGRTCARSRWRVRFHPDSPSTRTLRLRSLEDQLLRIAVAHRVRFAGCRFSPPGDDGDVRGDMQMGATTLRRVGQAGEAMQLELERLSRGAGLATEITEYDPVAELSHDPPLRRAVARNLIALGVVPERPRRLAQSCDLGNVSRRIPAVAPMVAIGSGGAVGTSEFAAQSDTEDAYRAMLSGAVVLAWTALDIAQDRELRARLLDTENSRSERVGPPA